MNLKSIGSQELVHVVHQNELDQAAADYIEEHDFVTAMRISSAAARTDLLFQQNHVTYLEGDMLPRDTRTGHLIPPVL